MAVMVRKSSHIAYLGHGCTQDVLILGLAEFWQSLTPCSFFCASEQPVSAGVTVMIGCGREELGHTVPSAPQEGSEVRELREKCQSHLEIKYSPGSINRRSKAW